MTDLDEQLSRQSKEAACRFAVDLACNGYPPKEIQRKLVEGGMEADAAGEIVRKLGRHMNIGSGRAPQQTPNQSGSGDMLYGGLFCVVGVVITVGSYMAAAQSGGGKFVIAWGAIVFGGMRFVRGLMRSAKA